MNYTVISTNIIIWAVFAGIILASICITFQKRAISHFINTLYSKNCVNDSHQAKSLNELEIKGKFRTKIILSALKSQTGLKRVICVFKEDDTVINLIDKPHIPSINDKFFLCGDDIDDILQKYTHKKSNPIAVIILVVILVIVAFIATYVTPWLTNYASNTFSDDSSTSSSDGVKTEETQQQQDTTLQDQEITDTESETEEISEDLSEDVQSTENEDTQKSQDESDIQADPQNTTANQ